MVVCKFFLEGRCRYGDRCFNEHVIQKGYNNSYQGQRYDQYERQRYESPSRYSDNQRYQSPLRQQNQNYSSSYKHDSRQGNGPFQYGDENYGYNNRYDRDAQYSSNPYSWRASDYSNQRAPNRGGYDAHQAAYLEDPRKNYNQNWSQSFQHHQQQPRQAKNHFQALRSVENKEEAYLNNSALEILKEDMVSWDEGKQWPFSCYFPFRGHPGFPEFDDISPEELRHEAYEAEKNNKGQEYVASYTKALQEAQQKRELLKTPNQNIIMAVKKLQSETLNLDVDPVKKQLFFGGGNDSAQPPQFNSQASEGTPSFFSSSPLNATQNTFSLGHLTSGSSARPQAGSVFGQVASNNSSATTGSMFTESSSVQKPFGNELGFGQTNDPGQRTSVFSNQPTADSAEVNVYSTVEDLTEEELEAFTAPTFTAGKIPINPPPRAMCF